MRPFLFPIAAFVVLASGCSRGSQRGPSGASGAEPNDFPATSIGYADSGGGAPFAVLEVFSSEGCSSCPPTEGAVDALAERTPGLFVLSFHVDYWDYLGHRDPYASAAATSRQSDYVRAWGGRSTYTPMLVLDGEELRSGTAGLDDRVGRALRASAPSMRLRVSVADPMATPLVVELVADGAEEQQILVAAVEHGLVQRPLRGENAGATLRHDNVARAWREVSSSTTRVELDVPTDARRQALRIVAVAFDGHRPRRVTGAAGWPSR